LISTRGYNIESLSVAPTNDPTVSRVTLVTIGSDSVMAQINAQLLKLVDVVGVEDMTGGDNIARELLLIKLQLPAEHVEAVGALLRRAGGRVLSANPSSYIVELTSTETEIGEFIASAATYGEIVEVVRSGVLGIARANPRLHVVKETLARDRRRNPGTRRSRRLERSRAPPAPPRSARRGAVRPTRAGSSRNIR
jgi:acetolactate synthase I/III small subunit